MRGLGLVALAALVVSSSAGAEPNPSDRCWGKRCWVRTLTATGAVTGLSFTATTGSGTFGLNLGNNVGIAFNHPTTTRTLVYNGSSFAFSGAAVNAPIFNSTIAAGSLGYTCTNIGCRFSLGEPTRYIYDTGAGLGVAGAVAITSSLAVGNGVNLQGGSLYNSVANASVSVSDAEGLALVGVATGSLAACNATAPPTGTRGAVQYDTTTSTYKYCNGTTWREFVGGTNSWDFPFYAYIGADYAEGQYIAHSRPALSAAGGVITSAHIRFTPHLAGVGAGNAVLKLDDSGTESCTLTFACTAAAGSDVSATESAGCAAYNPTDSVVHRLSWDASSACDNRPPGMITVVLTYSK